MKNPIGPFNAMAFYNPHGFVPAFKQARAFAGEGNGARVATLPDILEARLTTQPEEFPWSTYFTTMSAEYVGRSQKGHPIAIVAHGVGPMSTLDGVLAAYSFQFNDKDRNNKGGRISRSEFRKLESGQYGDVDIIDLKATWSRRPYQFSGHAITIKEIEQEPLWQARLGKKWREYSHYHANLASKWDHERRRESYSNPCILGMDGPGLYYSHELFGHSTRGSEDAIAHLLSIGGLMTSHHQYYEHSYELRQNRVSLASDVNVHGWSDGTRLLGIQGEGKIIIHPGLPSYESLVQTKLDCLWKQNPRGSQNVSNDFWHLVRVGKQYFTDYPKMGERMDNCEPEFLVTKTKEMPDGRKKFRTTIGGYHGFFKYGIDEVRRIAPNGANAYTIGDVEIEWNGGNPTHHVADVTFYKTEVDTSKRLVRMDDIYRDYDLMMALIAD